MRPRLFTAENLAGPGTNTTNILASMRPRLFTAENTPAVCSTGTAQRSLQ